MLRGVLTGILLLVTGCQAGELLPWRLMPVSTEAEALAGRRAAPVLEKRFGGTIDHVQALERMHLIGERLVAATPELACNWHFHLLASHKINAFSLPGGLVYITRGLYQRTASKEDLLAAIIAHEMAHVMRKDSLRPFGNNQEALQREVSTDSHAADYLAAADYNPQCLIGLLRLIEDVQMPGWAEVRLGNLAGKLKVSSNNSALTMASPCPH
ncbi:MAG: M48 family metalloprotease [Planctomycetota bacterium]